MRLKRIYLVTFSRFEKDKIKNALTKTKNPPKKYKNPPPKNTKISHGFSPKKIQKRPQKLLKGPQN
jgi:hypothetical protein